MFQIQSDLSAARRFFVFWFTLMEDSLLAFGDNIKSLGTTPDGKVRIGGYLVRFGSPEEADLIGDYFTTKTYLGAHDGNGADTMIHHGQPLRDRNGQIVKELEWTKDVFLPPVKTHKDAIGLFAETVCDMSDAWEAKVAELATAGKFKWSSGAAAHTVRRRDGQKTGEITRWVISEASLTPAPCEPRNTSVTSLKAMIEQEAIGAVKFAESDLNFDTEIAEMENQFHLDELKRANTWHTQPRDDHGRWTDGAGNLSASHVATVMKHEGIHDSRHAEVLDKIKSGEHKTRADVLAHIDSIHAAQGTDPALESQMAHLGVEDKNLIRQVHRDFGLDGHAIVARAEQLAGDGKVTTDHVAQAHHEAMGADMRRRGVPVLSDTQPATATPAQAEAAKPKIPVSENHDALIREHGKGTPNERVLRESLAEAISIGQGDLSEINVPENERDIIGALVADKDGHAYQPPSKEPRFKKDDEPFMPTLMNGWVTNGHLAILGDMPKGARDLSAEQGGAFHKPNLEKVFPKDDGTQIKPIVAHSPNGRQSVFMNNGAKVDRKYLDLLLSRYPDATFHESASFTRVIQVKSKGTKVGLLMPMASYSTPKNFPASGKKSLFGFGLIEFDFDDETPDEPDEIKADDEVGQTFAHQHAQALDAVRDSTEQARKVLARASEIIVLRSDSCKAGAVLSQTNHDRLSELLEVLKEHLAVRVDVEAAVNELAGFLATHAPTLYHGTDDTVEIGGGEGKSLDLDILEMEIAFLAQQSRAVGVTVPEFCI